MRDDLVLALGRLGAEANGAAGPEEALWCLTRAAPALLGDPGGALRPNAFREEPPPAVRGACAVFLRMPETAPRHAGGAYGFVAAFQPDANFGRVLAAYGGVFVAGSLAWGIVVDGFKPTMWDYIGSVVCLIGAAIIIVAPLVAPAGTPEEQ